MPLLAAVLLARSQAVPRLTVEGNVAHRRSYTVEQLRAEFAKETQEVSFDEKGQPGHAHAFPLAALLRAAEPSLDPLRKHADFSLAVVTLAPDGYSAVFSGAELSKELGKGSVWVALDWNGAPLQGADAPVRLIVTDDAKPSRWVHGVRTIRVVNLAPKGHGPAPEKPAGNRPG